jgi:nitrogen PTS system EIIA component
MAADAKASAFPVVLYQLLDEQLIVRFPEAKSKEPIVRQLTAALATRLGRENSDACLAKVMEREKGISTTLDTGLSLPHARLDDVKGFAAILGLVPKGLPDPQQPELTIKLVLLFFSTNDPAYFKMHLQFLRHVATLFQPAFIEQLLACPEPRDVLAALRAKET